MNLKNLWAFLNKPRGLFVKNLSSQTLSSLITAAGITASGASVTIETSWRVIAVHAAIRVLAESIAQLPLVVYRRSGLNRERATDHPLYWLLHNQPNEFQTSFEWRELMVVHLCTRGNHYSFINRVNGGKIAELLPLSPDVVEPKWKDKNHAEIIYEVDLGNGKKEQLGRDKIFHLKWASMNGLKGLSPIAEAREAIGLSMSAENHGAQMFGNGATPGGVLEYPGKLEPEARENIAKSWQDLHGGNNKFRTAVLEEGMAFKPTSISNKDAQYIEARKFQITEIARLFRLPPHMIGDLEKSTFSNIEAQALEFVKYTLTPWLVKIEQAVVRDLVAESERDKIFAEFLVDGLLRGEFATRMAGYQTAIMNGIMSRNEVRQLENKNPYEGGDNFLIPVNLAPIVAMAGEKK